MMCDLPQNDRLRGSETNDSTALVSEADEVVNFLLVRVSHSVPISVRNNQ